MTKEQNKIAQSILAKKPVEIKGLYMNPKGEFFTNESLGKNSLKKDQKLEWVARENVAEEKPEVDKEVQNPILNGSNDEVKEAVASLDDVTGLEQLLLEEQAGQNRKGATKAIQERIDALKATDNG